MNKVDAMGVSGERRKLGVVTELRECGLGWQGGVRTALAFALCVLMVNQPLMAAGNQDKRGPTAQKEGGVAQSKVEIRIEHALNRLTFGPRPGDVAAVEKMGLTEWFEQQLNPEKIDDSALDARLQSQFPAMFLSQQELMVRYPGQQVIRQLSMREERGAGMGMGPMAPGRPGVRGRFAQLYQQNQLSIPNDPAERAIYADQIALYKEQQQKKQEKDAAAAANGANTMDSGAPSGGQMMSDGTVSGSASAQAPAPIERRSAKKDAQAAPSQSSDAMSGGMPDYEAMAAGKDMKAGQQSAALPKSDVSDTSAPDAHVDKLYRDLEAVKILNLPPDERMRRVIAMPPKDFLAFRQSLSGPELAQFGQGLSGQQREIFAAMQNSTRMVGAEEMQVRMLRDLESNRQLEAVMTDFWLNHFNVYVRKNQNEPYLIPAYERETILPHALGKFEDLLVATAESPAMQVYLDNWQSIGPNSQAAENGGRAAARAQNPQVKAALKDRGLNENYARELMELHTLGVNGGYTQADVIQVAKVFTGWGIEPPVRGAAFQFDERKHEPGTKVVLGKTIKEDGMKEGLEVLHMLATSPATAKFISTKLAVRFVSDDPPPALVERMTQAYLKSDGDIKTVLRTMFESQEFWAPATAHAKVKTPEEFVISAVRASGAQVNNSLALVAALDKLGMPLYGMQTPNGYSWKSEGWTNTGALVNRMNFALVLAGDKLPGVRTDWTRLTGTVTPRKAEMANADGGNGYIDPEVAAKERRLETILLDQPLSEKTRMAVLSQSNDTTAAIQAAKEFQTGGGGLLGGGGGQLAGLFGGGGPAAAAALRNQQQDDRQAAIMAGLMLGSPEFQRR
ncbi:MAG TPA: DUF1800 family protein [Acidobacteriaceae bacterium]|nr:DUF1800 family protein [Acidobacteriaceae bacterium]